MRTRGYFLLFAAELIVLTLFNMPIHSKFYWWGWGDEGANLSVQAMLAQGFQPTVDFAYEYGLLSLLFGKFWFSLWGLTAGAYLAACRVFNVLMIWGWARLCAIVPVGRVGLALMMLALPLAIPTCYLNFAHAIEAVLLCHALVFHARGKRATALVLVTAGCFVKPSMSFFYGLILVLLMIGSHLKQRHGWRSLLRSFVPAAITGSVLGLGLVAYFGWVPVVRTLFPVAAMQSYAARNAGFFTGLGRDFWLPEGVSFKYYIGSVTGFWLVASLFLIVYCLRSFRRILKDRPGDQRGELIVTGCLLHLSFVFFFFGHAWSWNYYFYILVLAVAWIARGAGRRWTSGVAALALLALLGNTSKVRGVLEFWRTESPSSQTHGFWALSEERDEWAKVLEMTRDAHPALLLQAGAVELLAPQFQKPVTYRFVRSLASPPDIERKVAQLKASRVMVAHNIDLSDFRRRWPELQATLDLFEPIWSGQHFTVLEQKKASR